MTDKLDLKKSQEQFAFYMDILGHDVLNNNQAVLGYLELILAEPGFEKKVRRYAEKAVPHIRTSTLLVENVKKVLATRGTNLTSLKPLDLIPPLSKAPKDLERFFPDRKVRVVLPSMTAQAWVLSGPATSDLIHNALVDMVKLDRGSDVVIKIGLTEVEWDRRGCWRLRIENPNAQLPPIMRGRDLESVLSEDSSTAVRMTGMLFAKMVTGFMGGDFEAEELPGKGAAFTITLRKADGK